MPIGRKIGGRFMKPQIKIQDFNFYHDKGSSKFCPPSYFEWYRGPNYRPTEVFTDSALSLVRNSSAKTKVAWLLEPESIAPNAYEFIKQYHSLFDIVVSHKKERICPNQVFCPFGGTWLTTEERQVHPKNKNVSLIASDKNITEGHKLRHFVAQNFTGIDLYGYGYHPVEFKSEALKDYRYSIIIENGKFDWYFSEKLIDCFLCGTIPIYWGCPEIGEFFDRDGILKFGPSWQLQNILDSVSEKHYEKVYNHVKRNFEIAFDYMCPEDWLWNILEGSNNG